MRFSRLIGAALLGGLVAACGAEPEASTPTLRPVRVEEVVISEGSVDRSLAAVVQAGVESRLSFRVSGSVARLDVRVGDRVRSGQVLARLDPTDFELRVEEAKAALAQAEASLRRVEADFDRVRALYENNNASKAELDASRAAAESAVAQANAVTKQLEQAGQQLGYASLRAPADGAIASVSIEVNENVQAGQVICLLIAAGQPEVVVPVPEGMIAAVEKGQQVSVEIPALPGQTFIAEVTEVGVSLTGGAATYPVKARLVGATVGIRAGMAAEVTFKWTDGGGEVRLFVPGVAVGEDRDGRFVFVLRPGEAGVGTVERRAVRVGVASAAGVEIAAGVAAGELVVTAGVRRLSDGMRVRVPDAAGAPG